MTTIKKKVTIGAEKLEALRDLLQEIYHDNNASELNNILSQLLQIMQLKHAQEEKARV